MRVFSEVVIEMRYHGYAGQSGITRIPHDFSVIIFWNVRRIKANSGKAKKYIDFQLIVNTSTAIASRSRCQEQ